MPLTLSRKKNEAVVVNGPATIRIIRISRGRAVLRIEAGPETGIMREEIVFQKFDALVDIPTKK